MNARELIIRKREGGDLTPEEIDGLVRAYMAEEIPDYQMAAFLMAVVWRGMTDEETTALTRSLIASGRTMAFPDLAPTADKHSTGGVGDKVSIALAPLGAAAGLRVPMLSGRGLGHTGGTLDKLESIPGFTTRLDGRRFEAVLREVGCVMGGQSAELAPADGRIYALRDATGTIESLPLIVSSILSKKVAAGPDVLVLDVKVGRGAFMKRLEDAETLAQRLVAVGTRFGKKVLAFVTDMDVPLGRAVGNALEVTESVQLLRGEPVAEDFRELTLILTGAMLVASGRAPDLEAARRTLEGCITSGEAYDRFRHMVTAQDGDPSAVDENRLPTAPVQLTVPAGEAGVVEDIDPMTLALLVVDLGGGRRLMHDTVDPAVGAWLDRRPGEAVEVGDPVLTLHLPERVLGREAELLERFQSAIRIGGQIRLVPLVERVVGPKGSVAWQGWSTPLPI